MPLAERQGMALVLVALLNAMPAQAQRQVVAQCSDPDGKLSIVLTGTVLERIEGRDWGTGEIVAVKRAEWGYDIELVTGHGLTLSSSGGAWSVFDSTNSDEIPCAFAWRVDTAALEKLVVRTEATGPDRELMRCMTYLVGEGIDGEVIYVWRRGLARRTALIRGTGPADWGWQVFVATAVRGDSSYRRFEGSGAYCFSSAGRHCQAAAFGLSASGKRYTLVHGSSRLGSYILDDCRVREPELQELMKQVQ